MANIWRNLDWTRLTDILFTVLPALLCITLHELSHGAVAYALGDDTAKKAGRLTLNPIRHIDPWGLLMMVLFRFGWAKPVPVNMYKFKKPRQGMAVTALAGPLANLLIAAVFIFLYGVAYRALYIQGGALARGVFQMISTTGYLSLALAVFNLLPISPLDGSKILFAFLSDSAYAKLMCYERYGMILLMLLVVTGATSGVLSSVTGWLYDRLFFLAQFGFDLVN